MEALGEALLDFSPTEDLVAWLGQHDRPSKKTGS
ncbi:MAG: DUF4351 domain-containing protein [Leptolyngbyaceae cyanobacterium HOT.MB2.61]|nr:DUF4351 domain-containing protein [Leptolyngbyaceae cyanobacterium HOT.MB2.61]